MFENLEAVHIPVDYTIDDIEDYTLAHLDETEEGHEYLLELSLEDGETKRYRINLEYGPEMLQKTGLVDDNFEGGVQTAEILEGELEEIELLE